MDKEIKDRISRYISFEEATHSYTAKRLNIDNTPNEDQLANMKEVGLRVFDPVRANFGVAIYTSSFFRSTDLNKAIGGAHKYVRGVYVPTSQHCKGEAIDIDADVFGKVTNEEIFSYIKDNLEFDQLIAEGVENGHVEWVHVSYSKDNNRNQVLIMYREDGKSKYLPYTDENYKKYIKE